MDNPREYIGGILRGSNGKATNTLGGFSGLATQLRRKIAEEEGFDDYATGGKPVYGR